MRAVADLFKYVHIYDISDYNSANRCCAEGQRSCNIVPGFFVYYIMKQTIDKEDVPDRCWYYLLDFNDRNNWELIHEVSGQIKLHGLTKEQFWKLFELATQKDLADNVTQK